MPHTNDKQKKNNKYFKLIVFETYLSYYYSWIKANIIWNSHLKGQEDSTLWPSLNWFFFFFFLKILIGIKKSHFIE
jgi:hypothetical protein